MTDTQSIPVFDANELRASLNVLFGEIPTMRTDIRSGLIAESKKSFNGFQFVGGLANEAMAGFLVWGMLACFAVGTPWWSILGALLAFGAVANFLGGISNLIHAFS